MKQTKQNIEQNIFRLDILIQIHNTQYLVCEIETKSIYIFKFCEVGHSYFCVLYNINNINNSNSCYFVAIRMLNK